MMLDPVPVPAHTRRRPSEIDRHSQIDMGLADAEIKAISLGWRKNMDAVRQALLKHGAYDLFREEEAGESEKLSAKFCEEHLVEISCSSNPVSKLQQWIMLAHAGLAYIAALHHVS